jgi:drug/metabolite transporter (DMT)-like permease
MYYQLIGIFNILFWSLQPLVERKAIRITKDPFNMANLRFIFASIISLFLFFVYSKKTFASYNYKIYGIMIAVAIIGFLGKYFNYLLLERYKAAVVSAIVSPMILICTAVLGALFFGEELSKQQMLGIGVVSAGVFLLTYKMD